MIEVKFTLLDEETDEAKSDTVYIAGKPKGKFDAILFIRDFLRISTSLGTLNFFTKIQYSKPLENPWSF